MYWEIFNINCNIVNTKFNIILNMIEMLDIRKICMLYNIYILYF